LYELYKDDLPVPQPLAARVVRSGLLYRGDLITRRIPKARSIAELLSVAAPVPWDAVGRCVRRFHDAGVWHADLNAHNVLLDAEGRVHLVDFDRSGHRSGATGWKQANLTRLRRSLDKLTQGRLEAAAWSSLLDGYRAGG